MLLVVSLLNALLIAIAINQIRLGIESNYGFIMWVMVIIIGFYNLREATK